MKVCNEPKGKWQWNFLRTSILESTDHPQFSANEFLDRRYPCNTHQMVLTINHVVLSSLQQTITWKLITHIFPQCIIEATIFILWKRPSQPHLRSFFIHKYTTSKIKIFLYSQRYNFKDVKQSLTSVEFALSTINYNIIYLPPCKFILLESKQIQSIQISKETTFLSTPNA